MTELKELYQEVVLDHNSKPRNFKKIEGADKKQEGFNPLCGDRITLYLKMKDGRIEDVGFQGSGCAISRSSASMMTQAIKGKSKEEAEKLYDSFRKMIMRPHGEEYDADGLGDLEVLAGVSDYPARVKCATLSWHTMHNALEGKDEQAKTE